MNYLAVMWAKVRAVLVSMPPSQRYSVVALALVVAVSLGLMVMSGSGEEYSPVLTELSPSDMALVQSALTGSEIKYSLAGGMLSVPRGQKDKVLMTLSEKGGLPSDISRGYGFEELVRPRGLNFDTAQQEKMKHNIALGNMLSRQVMTMPEVRSAWVNIAVQSAGVFEPETATAAVSLTPRAQQRIPDSKLDAICRLVAAAVGPKLPLGGVTVTVPSTGQTYSPQDEGSSFSRASNRHELQVTWDEYYKKRVQEFLGATFGTIQTLVTVRLDNTSTVRTEREFSTIQQRTSTSSTSGGGQPGGDTLTVPNVGNRITAASTAPAGPSSETSEVEKISGPSLEVATQMPPGEVTDVQIAVLVDQDVLEALVRRRQGMAAGEPVAPEMLKAECEEWSKTLLALPIGGEEARKISKVSFSAAPFKNLQVAALEMPALPATDRVVGIIGDSWQRIALAVLAAVALFMIRSVARQAPATQTAIAAFDAAADEELMLPEIEVDVEQRRSAKMRESIEDMIKRDPHSAVSLIRRWMARES